MAQDWAKPFYNSKRWQCCRDSFIQKRILIDGGLCQECHKALGEIVHHKTMLTARNVDNEMISLNHDNLMYVCHECHDSFEGHGIGGRGKIKPLCTFDENGQPVSCRPIDHPEGERLLPPGEREISEGAKDRPGPCCNPQENA